MSHTMTCGVSNEWTNTGHTRPIYIPWKGQTTSYGFGTWLGYQYVWFYCKKGTDNLTKMYYTSSFE